MNSTQIQHVVMCYLKATACQLIEVSPGHVTVKLSPEADKELTNRPYYWNFVERTSVTPETMTFTFIFDPDNMPANNEQAGANTLIGVRSEHLTYGHARLQQIIKAVTSRGQHVQLYEEPIVTHHNTLHPIPYTSWLVINYKLEFACDMKREQLHSLGISLSTGEIIEEYHAYLLTKSLTPKLPAHTHLRETITLQRAKMELDKYIERLIQHTDHQWAAGAHDRMQVEIQRMASYYNDLTAAADDDLKLEIEEQYTNRLAEIEWQYKPTIRVVPINSGIFHLLSER